MSRIARIAVAFAIVAAAVAVASPARACPVCFGATDSPMAAGMNNGILFLLAIIGMVQVGFVALFVSFRRRAKAYQQQKDAFEVINGGVR
jgi:hypothetical protein